MGPGATAAGATVYVGLRQLVVSGHTIPLVVRIALTMGVTIVQEEGDTFPTRSGFGHHITLALLTDDATPMESNTLGSVDHPIVLDIPIGETHPTPCYYGTLGSREARSVT